jgi:4-hydroxy-tetrahydrodipicolinate synthase
VARGGQRLAGLLIYITDVHSIGLEYAQGLRLVRIGSIGLGRMGLPMARNLAAAGYCVWGRQTLARNSLRDGLLPLGLAQDVALLNDVPAGAALRWSGVAIDPVDPIVRCRRQMGDAFAPADRSGPQAPSPSAAGGSPATRAVALPAGRARARQSGDARAAHGPKRLGRIGDMQDMRQPAGAARHTAGTEPDRLWVPLLTHWRGAPGGAAPAAVDPERMAAHVRTIKPAVRQFMLAGSTGDGWDMGADAWMDVVRLSRRADVFAGTRVLYGVLRASTEEVVDWAVRLERSLAEEGAPAGEYAGIAVCPPIDPAATQDAILRHYEAVLERTKCPVAVYQLPQVTGCSIEGETLRALVAAAPTRVSMFKDTSGADVVAKTGPVEGVVMVRGAEGGYLDALAPEGPYDGWLLSTGNVFGPLLRRMLQLHETGEDRARERARRLSAVMTELVAALFEAAKPVPFGNPFSNANHAADHLLATGRSWRDRPRPVAVTGAVLPDALLEAAEDILGHLPSMPERGYLNA